MGGVVVVIAEPSESPTRTTIFAVSDELTSVTLLWIVAYVGISEYLAIVGDVVHDGEVAFKEYLVVTSLHGGMPISKTVGVVCPLVISGCSGAVCSELDHFGTFFFRARRGGSVDSFSSQG